jgi:hypothetical protein
MCMWDNMYICTKDACIYVYMYIYMYIYIGIYIWCYMYVYIYTYFNHQPWLLVSWNTIHLWLKFNTSSHFKICSARTFHFVIPYDPVIIPALSHFFRVIKSTIFYGNFPYVWWSIPMVVPWPWPWPRNSGPACSPWGCERFPHDIGLLRCARPGIHPRVASVSDIKHGFQWDIHGKWDI